MRRFLRPLVAVTLFVLVALIVVAILKLVLGLAVLGAIAFAALLAVNFARAFLRRLAARADRGVTVVTEARLVRR